MTNQTIQIKYTEEELRAELDCPLCKQHWIFPYPARQIFGKPYPSPEQLVSLHLYGCGTSPQYCGGFDPGKPFAIDNVNELTASPRLSPQKRPMVITSKPATV